MTSISLQGKDIFLFCKCGGFCGNLNVQTSGVLPAVWEIPKPLLSNQRETRANKNELKKT